jgi:hypothetical protein
MGKKKKKFKKIVHVKFNKMEITLNTEYKICIPPQHLISITLFLNSILLSLHLKIINNNSFIGIYKKIVNIGINT